MALINAKKATLLDTILLQMSVGGVNILWGVVTPNRWLVPLVCRWDLGRFAPRLVERIRRRYQSECLWTRFPLRRKTLLVLDAETMDEVLGSDHNSADPAIKKRALGGFVPNALVISSGPDWVDRRRFTEHALTTDGRVEYAEALLEVVFGEVGCLADQRLDVMHWRHFRALAQHISQQIIFGAGNDDPEMARCLTRMTRAGNWVIGGRRLSSFACFYRDLNGWLDRRQVDDKGPCLARAVRSATAEVATTRTDIQSEVGYWMFVLTEALELHVARTLALIAAHGDVQEEVRREVAGATEGTEWTPAAIESLDGLNACFREQLRLWTPAPLLLRRATDAFCLPDAARLQAEDQILMLPGVYHRTPAVFGERAHRFVPSAGGSGPTVYYFSLLRQSCPGERLASYAVVATLAALLAKYRFQLIGPNIDAHRIPYQYNHFAIALRAC